MTTLFYGSTALDDDETLDKEDTSCNDIFDEFRLALKCLLLIQL